MTAALTDDKVSRGGLPHPAAPARTPRAITAGDPVTTALIESPLRSQLRLLAALRGVAATAQATLITSMTYGFGVGIPMPEILATLAALILLLLLIVIRLRAPKPVTQGEFFVHLLCDVVWLTVTLYWAGGAHASPFADLYLIYIGMAALTLRWRYVLLTVAVTFLAWGLLAGNHVELDLSGSALSKEDLDQIGHGAHFVLVSLLVAYFGFRLAWVARRYYQMVGAAREREARSEAAVNLAALAAGAAHEVGTPLTTMAVLVSEMRSGGVSADDMRTSLEVMWDAIQACKRSMGDMVAVVGADRLAENEPKLAYDFLAGTIERFKPMRPKVPVTLRHLCTRDCTLLTGATLRQSLLCLIANAADASPEGVEIVLSCGAGYVQIDLLDRGPGIPAEIRTSLGRQFVTTKGNAGTGVGIFLADLNLTRMGGTLAFLDRDGGGTCARITLPTHGR